MSGRALSAADTTWTDLCEVGPRLLVVPLGSTEQHGPHLPLDTDTRIAAHLAGRLAAARPDVFLAPAVSFGSSGEHAGFPGTLSIGTQVLTQVLIELGRSADAFTGVVFVNGHGGNSQALRAAVDQLEAEGRSALGWSWTLPAAAERRDAHAGFVETSMLLAIDGRCVRVDDLEPGARESLSELWDRLSAEGVSAVSPNGVLGDPAGATAAGGQEMLDYLAEELVAATSTRFGDPSS